MTLRHLQPSHPSLIHKQDFTMQSEPSRSLCASTITLRQYIALPSWARLYPGMSSNRMWTNPLGVHPRNLPRKFRQTSDHHHSRATRLPQEITAFVSRPELWLWMQPTGSMTASNIRIDATPGAHDCTCHAHTDTKLINVQDPKPSRMGLALLSVPVPREQPLGGFLSWLFGHPYCIHNHITSMHITARSTNDALGSPGSLQTEARHSNT